MFPATATAQDPDLPTKQASLLLWKDTLMGGSLLSKATQFSPGKML